MGVAGAGKSVQGRLLADELGYAWISTGELLRVLITGTRRQEMLKGKLLSDDEVIKVIDKVLELIDPNNEFVLDGFPRTIEQTRWLLQENEKGRFSRILVLNLQANEKVVHDRLVQRGRMDDSEQAITKRFKEYHDMTLPIIDEFKRHDIQVHDIDAARDPQAIHIGIIGILGNQQR